MVFMSMRSIGVAAAVGMAIAVLLIAPVVLMGESSAHAETGINGYVRCLGGDAKPPPPGVSAENWFPSVHVIATDLDSGVPPAQVAQILVGMGVKPNDAVTRVRCFVANQPRGEGH
jgi:urea transporter